MIDCIQSMNCICDRCDRSCPVLAEKSYLLERNSITVTNPAVSSSAKSVQIASEVLSKCKGDVRCWVASNNPEGTADLFTYVAICEYGSGSRLHCEIYHLNLSVYIDKIKESWKLSSKPEELSYMEIWTNSASILIISGLRYMKFNDFECQTLLKLLDTRMAKSRTTLVVAPELYTLVGDSSTFLPKLKSDLGRLVIKC